MHIYQHLLYIHYSHGYVSKNENSIIIIVALCVGIQINTYIQTESTLQDEHIVWF